MLRKALLRKPSLRDTVTNPSIHQSPENSGGTEVLVAELVPLQSGYIMWSAVSLV